METDTDSQKEAALFAFVKLCGVTPLDSIKKL